MTLTEFLATANVDDATALTEAQAYTTTQGQMIPRNSMNAILAAAGLYNAFLAAAPTNDLIAAFMAESSTEYNFIQGTATGDAQIAKLDSLIAGDYPMLAALKPELIARCNKIVTPFANTTLEQVKAIRHPSAFEPVTIAAGQVVINEGELYSDTDNGAIRFTIAPAEDFTGLVKIRLFAKKDGETAFTEFPQQDINLNRAWTAGQPVSFTFKRDRSLRAYRHFKPKVKGPHAGVLTSVECESV